MIKYQILRPCLWFAKDEFVPADKLYEYFTPLAIRSLIADGFVKIIMP